jgi:molecular chaperone HtpG
MQEGQKGIYYITGESKRSIINSPFLEKLKKRDIEVLFMVDPLDEYVTQQLKDYGDKKLICITKENLQLDEDNEKENFEQVKKDYENVCKFIKETIGDDIEKVVVSNRLDSSPCVLVTSEYGWTANMQRIMKAQALRSNDMGHMMNKKTLEINPYNNIIKKMKERLEQQNTGNTIKDLVHLLYDITLQSSGFTLDDPSTFSNRILKLINLGMGIDEEESSIDVKVENSVEVNSNLEATTTMEEFD